MRPAIVLCLAASACGRVGFEAVPGDGAIGTDADVVSRERCPPAPRPTGSATQVVGDGTAASCDAPALAAALATGGHIAFDCGPAMHTILVGAALSITRATILDGGGRITLDGGGATRVLDIDALGQAVTLVDLVIANGATTDSGAGIQLRNGQLTIIGTTLHDNRGPDAAKGGIGGGAIAAPPISGTLAIYDSILRDNSSANGGAISIWNDLTIVESVLANNAANGTTGNGGDGGLGGAIINAGRGRLSFCGVSLENNRAGNLGGALHRVCTDASCVDRIERSSIVGNTAPNAGGVYHQDAAMTLSQTTIASNQTAGLVGGYWYIGSSFVAENLTVASNTAGAGTGPGLSVSAQLGSISFSTFVGNRCTGPTCSAAAIASPATMALRATLIADNTVDTQNVPVSCTMPMVESNDNFQWPVARPGGGSDDPTALCSTAIRVEDPRVAPLAPREASGGRFLVATPQTASPALGITTTCPAEDQLGRPRPAPCSAGSVEP